MSVSELFGIGMNPLELVVRGSAMYWVLFFVFRFVVRRDVGAVGIADLLLLVLIADAAQNAMAGGYSSITEGVVLVFTIVGWNWLLDWASSRSRRIAKWVSPPALVLVRHGTLVADNLKQEHLSPAEVLSKLRTQGVEKLEEVKMARLEPDGEVSVIKYANKDTGSR